MAVVYILQCADGTLYTGWTTDLERRLQAHNSGRGARYTRGRRPVRLVYSEEQNVPADVTGMRAAVVIEAVETHTRTGFVDVDLSQVPDLDPKTIQDLRQSVVQVPVTHAKVFGWYDNEYGSYTNLMGDLTVHIHRMLD